MGFGDGLNPTAIAAGNPFLRRFAELVIQELGTLRDQSGVGVGAPPVATWKVSGTAGSYTVAITNPQDAEPPSGNTAKRWRTQDRNQTNRVIYHQIQLAGDNAFTTGVRSYGPSTQQDWQITGTAGSTQFLRFRSSYDRVTWNAWQTTHEAVAASSSSDPASTLTLKDVADDAGTSRYAVLAIDGNRRAVIDFSQPHVNKTLDYVPDGAVRFAVAFIDANQRALIDLAQAGHLGKNLSNLPDDAGSSRYAVSAIDGARKALVDFASAHTNKHLGNVANTATRVAIDIVSAAPADTPASPTARFDVTSNKLWMWNGTAWVSVLLA